MASLPSQITATTFTPFSASYTPRAVVRLDGAPYLPVRFELNLNAHGATDTALITLPLKGNPDWTQALFRGASALNADQPVYVEVFAGFPYSPGNATSTDVSQLRRRFYGVVDQYALHVDRDEVEFSCRSLAAPLVSDKITIGLGGGQSTTTAFVQAMAKRYGLTAKVLLGQAPLTLQQVLRDEFIAGVHNVGIWDLILQCAMWDDVDVWVDAQGVLNYVAPSLLSRTTVDLQYGRDIQTLSITHSPQFSKNIQVEVRSYTKKVKQSSVSRVYTGDDGGITYANSSRTVTSAPVFGTNQSVTTSISSTGTKTTTLSTTTGGATSSGFTKPGSESGKEKYVFYVPGLAPGDCTALAKKLWRQISMMEFAIALRVPMTVDLFAALDITSLVHLHGTPFSLAEGTYWPRRLVERFDPLSEEGWHVEIDAVNHELPQGAV